MALEHILSKIKEETEKEVAQVNSEIMEKIKSIAQDGDKKREKLRHDMFEEARLKSEAKRVSELAGARLDFRKKLLQEKQNFLNQAFQKAFDYVRNLEDDAYRKFMKRLFLEVSEPGEGKILISPKDKKRIDPSFVKEINQALQKNGVGAKYELSEANVDIDGGFILKIGNVELNCSFSTILKKKREELELEVSKLLFQEKEKGKGDSPLFK